MWIHQDAWFHISEFEAGYTQNYSMKNPDNGLYIFNLEGDLKIQDMELSTRDGMGIWNVDTVKFEAMSKASFLIMEVPMHI